MRASDILQIKALLWAILACVSGWTWMQGIAGTLAVVTGLWGFVIYQRERRTRHLPIVG